MMTTEELGRRLKQARERAGRTQDEAAAVLGLDATAIAKIERGKRGVGALEVKSLSALYGVPVDSLLRDKTSRAEVSLHIAMRAGKAVEGKAEVMLLRLQQIIADDRWLRDSEQEAGGGMWIPMLEDENELLRGYEGGYKAADRFRDYYGLGDAPIADLIVLADELGVLVSHLPLGEHDAPDGCSALDPATGAAYVLINSDKPRARRRFTVAHELGHLALGHLQDGEIVIDETLSGWSPQETEANAFAAGLLMPESGVRGAVARIQDRLSQKAGPLEWIVWLAASFGVSEEAAAYRVKNLELDRTIGGNSVEAFRVAKEQPELIRQARGRLGLAEVMIDGERGGTEVGPSMRARIARALEAGRITVTDAAGMLHVSLPDAYRWIVETGLPLGTSEVPS
jgi:Zn-dependent peptidase ImmA (M78 family)/transcriptional regulator with XRE-family HTH domain